MRIDSKRKRRTTHDRRRGSTLVTVLVITAVMTTLAVAALTVTTSSVDEVSHERRQIQALYSAEAGISAGMGRIATAYQTGAAIDPNVGTEDVPESMQRGEFWTTITENADGTMTLLSTGSSGLSRRSIEAIVTPVPPGPFEHSMYAGNLSGDAAFTLEMGGTGGQADHITGDVYSGGDVVVTGDALLEDEVTAGGTITGTIGQGGLPMEAPQLLDIDYEEFHDFDVGTLFESAPRVADDAGGTAGQLPSTSPAHIFRKDPTDRQADVDSTEKADYFLEDPYEAVTQDLGADGSDAFSVSLPEEANNSVYFIDGNLWLHNRKTLSLKLKNEGVDPTRVTFVVKGNVYFSDNFFYGDAANDGVAFLALSDPDVEDSGNVYFGDPTFGTMQYAEALIFAEDTFYDNNLDAAGSTQVQIRGSMTAGNQVDVVRDYTNPDGSVSHTKLELIYDPRQAAGFLNLPGIPMKVDHPVGYVVATWREVPVPRTYVPATQTIEVETPPAPNPDDPLVEEDEIEGGGEVEIDETTSKDWRKRWKKKNKEWKRKKRKGKWKKKHGGY